MFRKRGIQRFAMATCLYLFGPSYFLTQSLVLGGPQQEVRQGYYVISNIVEKGRRDIYILLNEEYFTEEFLRSLLKEFFEKYPEPEMLDVWLYSDLEQVRGFLNGRPYHPAELIISAQDPTRWERYARALLFRVSGNEVIRYYVPGSNDVNSKTIVVKGKDPAYTSN